MPNTDDSLAVGESTTSRLYATGLVTMTSQVLRLTYFTANKSENISRVSFHCSTTAAGATPSLVRYGVYSEDADSAGALNLIAATPSDTALFAVINTAYPKALSASFNKVAGRRYALGCLVVTAAAAPTVVGLTPVPASLNQAFPRLATTIAAQADLPTAISAATVNANPGGSVLYGEVLP